MFKGTLLKDTATKDPIPHFFCVEHVVFVEAWLLKKILQKNIISQYRVKRKKNYVSNIW